MNIYQHFELFIEQPFSYKLLHEFCMACKSGNGRIQTYVKMVRDRNSILVAFPLSIIGWATAL